MPAPGKYEYTQKYKYVCKYNRACTMEASGASTWFRSSAARRVAPPPPSSEATAALPREGAFQDFQDCRVSNAGCWLGWGWDIHP